jgi:hypothetical protein
VAASWPLTEAPASPFRGYVRTGTSDTRTVKRAVAQLMGHTNADVTINVYTQVLDASLRTAVDRIGGELFTIVHDSETGAELNR